MCRRVTRTPGHYLSNIEGDDSNVLFEYAIRETNKKHIYNDMCAGILSYTRKTIEHITYV